LCRVQFRLLVVEAFEGALLMVGKEPEHRARRGLDDERSRGSDPSPGDSSPRERGPSAQSSPASPSHDEGLPAAGPRDEPASTGEPAEVTAPDEATAAGDVSAPDEAPAAGEATALDEDDDTTILPPTSRLTAGVVSPAEDDVDAAPRKKTALLIGAVAAVVVLGLAIGYAIFSFAGDGSADPPTPTSPVASDGTDRDRDADHSGERFAERRLDVERQGRLGHRLEPDLEGGADPEGT